MQNKLKLRAVAAFVLGTMAFGAVAGQGYGLTADGRLIKFKTARPDAARAIGFLTGFNGGDTALIGIDFRAQDGLLYGVGNAGGVYTIDLSTAAMTATTSPLTIVPSGASFGVDFNPAANRLRVVSDTGQNLRHDVSTAAAVTTNDTALSGTGIVGAAYTNNDTNATTATTLFDLDATANTITIQAPANNGTLSPAGSLGADPVGDAGFDIWSTIVGGVTVNNSGYAVLNNGGVSTGGSVNLLTGAFAARGAFPALLSPVVDISVQND